MKKITLIILITILSGCEKRKPIIKPFIIVDKSSNDTYSSYYTYQDKNGNQVSFVDVKNKYDIGDTIK